MKPLTKAEAQKIAEVTSSIYLQGSTWVMSEWDLASGATRLTRGLSERAAQQKLKLWRKERVEQLLRENAETPAYTIREWHENPTWKGGGVWRWAKPSWYTTKEEAEKALTRTAEVQERLYEIFETKAGELPGHFTVH